MSGLIQVYDVCLCLEFRVGERKKKRKRKREVEKQRKRIRKSFISFEATMKATNRR